MKFLSVRSDICRQLPSDSTSRWTPLPLTMQFPLLGLARDFHPLDNAHAERTSNYKGTSGYLVTGPNGNTIFFPASGYRFFDVLDNHGSYGYYWSRSLTSGDISRACRLDFCSDDIYPAHNNDRISGFTVRPVAE